MRVVAGVARGRRLEAPRGSRLRPTSDRVREAIFASLGSLGAIEGARVLDLYAGTGALGIEALSRGAETATFVDRDADAVAAIKANLAATGFGHSARVVRDDTLRYLAGATDRDAYDVVLADPPYDFEAWPAVLERLRTDLLVIESRREVDAGPAWEVIRTRRYGDTTVAVLRSIRPA